MEFGDPLLEKFILDEIKFLREYIEKGNVNPQFAEMMNKKIAELTEVNNGIYLFKHADAWAWVEDAMERMESMNPYLVGHLIEFNVDYRKCNWSKITIPNELL